MYNFPWNVYPIDLKKSHSNTMYIIYMTLWHAYQTYILFDTKNRKVDFLLKAFFILKCTSNKYLPISLVH